MPAIETVVLALISGVIGALATAAFKAYLTDQRRLRFEPVRPTVTCRDGTWFFYCEFKPVIGSLVRSDSAATNVGGSVHLTTIAGETRYYGESYWDGRPLAATATLYGKRGLLLFRIFPRGHMVIFFSAATAPYADQLRIPPEASSFDWTECKEWRIDVAVSSHEANAGFLRNKPIEQLCRDAWCPRSFPGLATIIDSPGEVRETMLIKDNSDAIYFIEEERKRLIPNLETFASYRFDMASVIRVSDKVLEYLPSGDDMPLRREIL